MLRRIFYSFIAFFLALGGFAQNNTPKYSNEFLSIGVGARALGMANTNVALTNDVTASFWNPAGLTNIESDLQIGAMHSEYFAGIAKYDYAGIAKTIDSSSTIGLSFIRFGVDDIPNTTELIDNGGNLNYDRITSFTAADYAFIFSYARKTKITGLSLGANFKVIHRKIGDFAKSWGFGLDASAQYKRSGWIFGVNARDITTTYNAWSYTLDQTTQQVFTQTGNEIPENGVEITLPKLLTGVVRQFQVSSKIDLAAEIDMDFTFDGNRNVLIKSDAFSIDPHLGAEIGYEKLVYVRLGIGNFQQETNIQNENITTFQPNFGIGLRFNKISIDYALSDIGDVSASLYSNVFSVKFDLSKSRS